MLEGAGSGGGGAEKGREGAAGIMLGREGRPNATCFDQKKNHDFKRIIASSKSYEVYASINTRTTRHERKVEM